MDIQKMFYAIIHYVFPKNCFEEMFVHYNFLEPECMKLVLSRCLGLAIIAGSIMVKLPQIMKIHRAQSGAGVSMGAQLLDLTALTATMGYSVVNKYPFSAWGEALFLEVQTAAIVVLILHYRGQSSIALAFLVSCTSLVLFLTSSAAPLPLLSFLQACQIPIVLAARSLQAYQNYSNQSTGQLSLVTVALTFAGSLARIFTSTQETGDKLIVATYCVASVMNGLIFSQIFMYWGQQPRKKTL